VITAKWGW